jgi:hypothetical protein
VSLIVPLSNHQYEKDPYANFEVDQCEGTVSIEWTRDDPDPEKRTNDRQMIPEEARALAAALIHYAAEADR